MWQEALSVHKIVMKNDMRSYCLLSGDIETCSKCAPPFQSRKQVTGDNLHYIYSAMQQARNFMNSNPYSAGILLLFSAT